MITVFQLPFAAAICGGAVAIGVLLRAHRFVARWVFAAGVAVLAFESACDGWSANATSSEKLIHWQQWKLLSLSLLPGIWLLFSLCYARGNASEFLAKWRISIATAFLIPTTLAVVFRNAVIAATSAEIKGLPPVINLGWCGLALYLFLLLSSVLVLMNLERTFRASVGTLRWRIKFILLAVSVLFVVRLYTSSQVLLFRSVDLSLESLNSGALIVATLLVLRSFFRIGHFDLDVYPSQSVLQGSFTIVLAGIYLLTVGIGAEVVIHLGGSTTFPLTAFVVLVALVLLTIVLQSDRVRLYSKRFVSRHFERPFYDYRVIWHRFTESTASQVERVELCRTLVRLVAEIFETLSVSIWLLDDKREQFVLIASTSISEAHDGDSVAKSSEAGELLRYFQSHLEPIDIETMSSDWSAALRQLHPSEFPHGGHRICTPIVGRGEVLGILILGDRVAASPFSVQDFDMLKCVSDHAAAGLLNVQLAQRLLQAKELEAFQTMAAFFVHDLKNSASTLNLMLQNLPVHFDDPAFREDALRGVSKAVDHLNQIIGRLSLLRHEFKLRLAETDLNLVIERALQTVCTGPNLNLKKEWGTLPAVLIDEEQIAKVVTNLVLNAVESFSGQGEVVIATSQNNGWVVLAVTDNGGGMSQEFIARSLFRPFQTTKKNGLGIGMFQCKMIVEAHGGRIAVASEPGQGSTFQVFLPGPRQT